MSETMMSLNGRLYPFSIYKDLKAAQDARQAAHDARYGKYTNTEAGRAQAAAAFMQSNPVDRVEIAAPQGELKEGLTESRVTARINGELDGQPNKHGGVDFAVPAPSVYGRPSIAPAKFFG